MVDAPVYGPLEVVPVLRGLPHELPGSVRYLADGNPVDLGELDYLVHGLEVPGVVQEPGSYPEGHLAPEGEPLVYGFRPGEVQAVAEQECLGAGVDSELHVVGEHLLSPLHRVAGVVAEAGEQGRVGHVEVLQEAVGGDAVGQEYPVLDTVFLNPGLHQVVVRVGGVVEGVALADQLVGLVGHRALRGGAEQEGEVDVGGADEGRPLVGVAHGLPEGPFLELLAEPAAGAELREGAKPNLAGNQVVELGGEPGLGVVDDCLLHLRGVGHAEPDLGDDGHDRDLVVALVHVVAPEVDFGLEGFAVEGAGDVAAVYGVPA